MRLFRLLLYAELAALTLTAGMAGSASARRPGPRGAVAVSRSPSALAEAISERPLAQAVKASRQALARGGIAVAEGRRAYARAKAPAPVAFTRVEVLHTALEAHAGGTSLTLAELAGRLRRAGFPFPKRTDPGQDLVAFLKDWVLAARKRPQAAANFAPLFLAETAGRRSPAIDLAAGGYRAGDYRLSLLEIDLLAAAFTRGQPKPRRRPARGQPKPRHRRGRARSSRRRPARPS